MRSMMIAEHDILASLLPRLTADADLLVAPGDDCAVVATHTGTATLIAVDQIVENVHYYGPATSTPTAPQLAGRKLLCRNLSDIAAMGGQPRYALFAMTVPRTRQQAWLDGFIDGLLECAREYGVHIIGGDTSSGNEFVASLTIVGNVSPDKICRRNGGRCGDILMVTGSVGGSLVTGSHLTFVPRLQEAAWLGEQRLVNAMIDVSDGLLTDAHRLCTASGVYAQICENTLPCTEWGLGYVSCADALTDGEDYELLFAVPATCYDTLISAWPFETRLTAIGHLRPQGPTATIVNERGENMLALYGSGYQHFADGEPK